MSRQSVSGFGGLDKGERGVVLYSESRLRKKAVDHGKLDDAIEYN